MSKTPSILDHYPDYEVNIGIEVHVQLQTNTKIFCSCPNQPGAEPNSNICMICTAQPGALPVLNKEVVNFAIQAGLATACTIAPHSFFARKHYFYPDLPKNYQITQSSEPICQEGFLEIRLEDGSWKKIRLIRIHMEEDAGKNIHATDQESFVDLNRAGTPLLEMVSYPDISSAYEARTYLKSLRAIVMYLGISSGDMEKGSFRADTNISVRKKGAEKLGTRCELKNINSFKFIGDAIEFEIERQIEILQAAGKVIQETRLWDTKNRKTKVMRGKEEAADYRYFRDPDLPLIDIDDAWILQIKKTMPELPREKFLRYVQTLGLSPYEAEILVDDAALSLYFEAAYKLKPNKQLVNWILRDVMGYLNEHKITLDLFKVTPAHLAGLVGLLESGVINSRAAQEVFAEMATSGQEPAVIVKEKGLEQIGSSEELEAIISKMVAEYPAQVAEYQAGKHKVFGFFVGESMKRTKGKGDPKLIQELLKKHLSS
jgi:aspartyl-tRNA(Asn)/glutamyl-tRNA(Gln) amidotransferase subunit B